QAEQARTMLLEQGGAWIHGVLRWDTRQGRAEVTRCDSSVQERPRRQEDQPGQQQDADVLAGLVKLLVATLERRLPCVRGALALAQGVHAIHEAGFFRVAFTVWRGGDLAHERADAMV